MARKRTPTPNEPARFRRWAAPLALSAVVALTGARSVGGDESSVRFGADLSVAMRHGQARNVVTVVYFTARRCKWCRKMQVTTFADRRVKALANRFSWAKVNIDEHAELGAIFGIRGVPHVALLDVEGRIIASQSGYIPPAKMVSFLRRWVDKAKTTGDAETVAELIGLMKRSFAAADTPAERRAAMTPVMERLAQPVRSGREKIIEAIGKLGPVAWPELCEMLSDKRLSARAAAGEALARATGADLPFDPFADARTRSRHVAAWKKWIETNKDRPATQPTTQPTTKPAPATRPIRQVNL